MVFVSKLPVAPSSVNPKFVPATPTNQLGTFEEFFSLPNRKKLADSTNTQTSIVSTFAVTLVENQTPRVTRGARDSRRRVKKLRLTSIRLEGRINFKVPQLLSDFLRGRRLTRGNSLIVFVRDLCANVEAPWFGKRRNNF